MVNNYKRISENITFIFAHEVNMDKRKYIRVKSEFYVWYQTFDDDDFSFGKPLSINISEGGMLLKTMHFIKVGTLILTKFSLPSEKADIDVLGKIVWVKKYDSKHYFVGVQFEGIKKKMLKQIKSFVINQIESCKL